MSVSGRDEQTACRGEKVNQTPILGCALSNASYKALSLNTDALAVILFLLFLSFVSLFLSLFFSFFSFTTTATTILSSRTHVVPMDQQQHHPLGDDHSPIAPPYFYTQEQDPSYNISYNPQMGSYSVPQHAPQPRAYIFLFITSCLFHPIILFLFRSNGYSPARNSAVSQPLAD